MELSHRPTRRYSEEMRFATSRHDFTPPFGAGLTIEQRQPPVLEITLGARQTGGTIAKNETENVGSLDCPVTKS